MIRVLLTDKELTELPFDEVNRAHLIVQNNRVVKDAQGPREGETVGDLEAWLHDLARDNPGRAADVEVTRRMR